MRWITRERQFALIVRAADCGRPHLAEEAARLLAIAKGGSPQPRLGGQSHLGRSVVCRGLAGGTLVGLRAAEDRLRRFALAGLSRDRIAVTRPRTHVGPPCVAKSG